MEKEKEQLLIGHWSLMKEVILLCIQYKRLLVVTGVFPLLIYTIVFISPLFSGITIKLDSGIALFLINLLFVTTFVVFFCIGTHLLKGKTILDSLKDTLKRTKALAGLILISFLLEKTALLPIILERSFGITYPLTEILELLIIVLMSCVMIYTLSIIYIFVNEKVTAYEAVTRSYSYIRNRWFKVLTRMFLFFILLSIPLALVFFGIIIAGLAPSPNILLVNFLTILLFFILLPPMVAFPFALSRSLKKTMKDNTKENKKEGKRFSLLLIMLSIIIVCAGGLLIKKGEITMAEFFLSETL